MGDPPYSQGKSEDRLQVSRSFNMGDFGACNDGSTDSVMLLSTYVAVCAQGFW